MPPNDEPYALLQERAAAACNTIDLLTNHGLPSASLAPSDQDDEVAAAIVHAFAEDEEKLSSSISTPKFSSLTPAVLIEVDSLLSEFGRIVVKNSVQIRHLVTNKLILETTNPDARIRIRALELLGKISDVGLFSDRSEVTITHQSTDELKTSLRDKLNRLREKVNPTTDVIDVLANREEDRPSAINLDEELGIPEVYEPQEQECQ
jgi:hypothetical protein